VLNFPNNSNDGDRGVDPSWTFNPTAWAKFEWTGVQVFEGSLARTGDLKPLGFTFCRLAIPERLDGAVGRD
jgi:hypothetical protein